MAARRVKTPRGLNVEVWETSFRVPGQATTLSIGRHFTDERLVDFIDGVYEIAYQDAKRQALADVQDAINDKLASIVFPSD